MPDHVYCCEENDINCYTHTHTHTHTRNMAQVWNVACKGYLFIRFFNRCRRLPEAKGNFFLFLHWSSSKFLLVMAACTPSIHVFLWRPLFLLSPGINSIINFGILSSGILLTWPHHCSLVLSMMSLMSGFSFTPIISFREKLLVFQGAPPHVADRGMLTSYVGYRANKTPELDENCPAVWHGFIKR